MSTARIPTPDHVRRIEDLGRSIIAFTDLTDKLQHSHDRLLKTVQALQAELSEKNRQLERKNRLAALGEMAAGMAHEIRNPLGGIQLYSSMLAKDLADRPDSLKLVQKISGGVRRLEGLVTQVLQFSREMAAHVTPCDLAEIIQQAVELAAPHVATKEIECAVIGPAHLGVMVDPLLLGQAVLNLLLNAVEAVPPGPGNHVQVQFGPSVNETGRQFWLAVTDTGPGIPGDVLDRIFNPFFTTKETGTGLGLAIVHRVIEAHDGVITASNIESGGAKFEVRI